MLYDLTLGYIYHGYVFARAWARWKRPNGDLDVLGPARKARLGVHEVMYHVAVVCHCCHARGFLLHLVDYASQAAMSCVSPSQCFSM